MFFWLDIVRSRSSIVRWRYGTPTFCRTVSSIQGPNYFVMKTVTQDHSTYRLIQDLRFLRFGTDIIHRKSWEHVNVLRTRQWRVTDDAISLKYSGSLHRYEKFCSPFRKTVLLLPCRPKDELVAFHCISFDPTSHVITRRSLDPSYQELLRIKLHLIRVFGSEGQEKTISNRAFIDYHESRIWTALFGSISTFQQLDWERSVLPFNTLLSCPIKTHWAIKRVLLLQNR